MAQHILSVNSHFAKGRALLEILSVYVIVNPPQVSIATVLFEYIVAVLPDVGHIAWLDWPAGRDGDFNIRASVCTIQQTPLGYFIGEFNLSSTSHPKQYSQGLNESSPVCLIMEPNKPLWPRPPFTNMV